LVGLRELQAAQQFESRGFIFGHGKWIWIGHRCDIIFASGRRQGKRQLWFARVNKSGALSLD
jgi:hypothetical protein